MDKHNVTAVFNGHEHIYSRREINGAFNTNFKNDILQIITGGAGTNVYGYVTDTRNNFTGPLGIFHYVVVDDLIRYPMNISREMLQHDRQLKFIAKNIKTKIKNELENLLKNEREKYEKFYESFDRQLKYGVYSDFGSNKDDLQDLLMFYSSKEKKMVTLDEYVSRMPEEQKYIYYAVGESVERIEKLPQTELVSDKGYEILYFTDDVDEFAIKMLRTYKDKEIKFVSGGDLGIDTEENKNASGAYDEGNKDLFDYMKNVLSY